MKPVPLLQIGPAGTIQSRPRVQQPVHHVETHTTSARAATIPAGAFTRAAHAKAHAHATATDGASRLARCQYFNAAGPFQAVRRAKASGTGGLRGTNATVPYFRSNRAASPLQVRR